MGPVDDEPEAKVGAADGWTEALVLGVDGLDADAAHDLVLAFGHDHGADVLVGHLLQRPEGGGVRGDGPHLGALFPEDLGPFDVLRIVDQQRATLTTAKVLGLVKAHRGKLPNTPQRMIPIA